MTIYIYLMVIRKKVHDGWKHWSWVRARQNGRKANSSRAEGSAPRYSRNCRVLFTVEASGLIAFAALCWWVAKEGGVLNRLSRLRDSEKLLLVLITCGHALLLDGTWGSNTFT